MLQLTGISDVVREKVNKIKNVSNSAEDTKKQPFTTFLWRAADQFSRLIFSQSLVICPLPLTIRCYHSGPEWTWERWQWSGTPHLPTLQHCWNLIIRLFSVIIRTLVRGGVLPLCREAVSVFYSPSWEMND